MGSGTGPGMGSGTGLGTGSGPGPGTGIGSGPGSGGPTGRSGIGGIVWRSGRARVRTDVAFMTGAYPMCERLNLSQASGQRVIDDAV